MQTADQAVSILCRCPAAEGVPARVYDHLDPERSSRRHHHKHAGALRSAMRLQLDTSKLLDSFCLASS